VVIICGTGTTVDGGCVVVVVDVDVVDVDVVVVDVVVDVLVVVVRGTVVDVLVVVVRGTVVDVLVVVVRGTVVVVRGTVVVVRGTVVVVVDVVLVVGGGTGSLVSVYRSISTFEVVMNSATSEVSVAVKRSAPSSSLKRTSLPGMGGSKGKRLAPPRPTTK
jgi:hypothetical protein